MIASRCKRMKSSSTGGPCALPSREATRSPPEACGTNVHVRGEPRACVIPAPCRFTSEDAAGGVRSGRSSGTWPCPPLARPGGHYLGSVINVGPATLLIATGSLSHADDDSRARCFQCGVGAARPCRDGSGLTQGHPRMAPPRSATHPLVSPAEALWHAVPS